MRKSVCFLAAMVWSFVATQTLASEALNIGSQKQLFIDGYIVESISGRYPNLAPGPICLYRQWW